MDNISNVDVSLLVSPGSAPTVQITATTFFDPEIGGTCEDESVVEVPSCCSSCPREEEQRQDEDGISRHSSDFSPGPISRPPTSRATAHWINHNIPLLHEYAVRQVSPPLFNRVNVEFNHPSQFVMGTMQMLANRDKEGEEDPEPTRRTPPQLLEGYVDIDRWAKEYLRTQFGLERLGDSVPELLAIITNNFYEAHMHLMDAIVKKALSNMEIRRGPWLEAGDFGFGFDLHVAQEMPFLVNAHHRVRETLSHLNAASKPSPTPPAEGVTRYGRRPKPTAGARQAAALKAKDSKEEPLRGKQKQIAPEVSVLQRNATKSVVWASPSGTDDSVVDAPIKRGRPRKAKPDAKTLLTQPTSGDTSINVPNKTRQPLGSTSLTNTAPPGTVGGKTLAHLALIKDQGPISSSTSRREDRRIDQRPPKIIIKPLAHFTSRSSSPRGSPAPWNTSTVDTSSGGLPSGVNLARDTAEVLPTLNPRAPQDLFATNSIPKSSSPLPASGVPSSETSHHTGAVGLKRKRD